MVRYKVDEQPWSGVAALHLADTETGTEALLVPSLGGNLISLTNRGEELLRRPPDAATLRERPGGWGVPVLMPPNRIAGGRFQFNGREYQLELTDREGPNHIHGFALRRPWRVGATETLTGATATLIFAAEDHPDVIAQFPHPFVLSVTYTLAGQTLHCSPTITNHGAEPMPFGLGFHPYFLAPEANHPEIRFTAAKRWETENWLPTGRFMPALGPYDLSTWQQLHAVKRGEGYVAKGSDPDGWSRFELADRAAGRILTLRAAPAYRHWVLFNGFAGSVSPEPYTCMTNAFNLDLPREVSGMAVLGPGESHPAGDWTLAWEQLQTSQ